MKITGIRTQPVFIEFDRPIGTAIHRIDGVAALLVWLDTNEGLSGESYLWTMGARRLPVLEAMVRAFEPVVIGKDPRDIGAIWDALWADANFLGHKGVTLFGIAAIDWACWDILGQSLGQPVGRLLGWRRDRIGAYASGGLWASMTLDELCAEAEDFVAQGFRAMKMRVGQPDPRDDVERVAAVRGVIGDEIELMVDANQGLDVARATRLGRWLEEFDLTWFEEPVMAYDLRGSARVARALDTPIASGETEYGRYGFAEMIELGAADILMPDLERVGGVSEFMKVANMASARDIEVSPHIFTEHSLQLCAAISNCRIAEHMPWFEDLFEEELEIEAGEILIPDRAGMGFRFNDESIDRYAIDD
jgi:L-alanine-DL-glutamate epimerase-like enolase superfamily enzyme